jgi:hypothetical protein
MSGTLDVKWIRQNKENPLFARPAGGPSLDAFGRQRVSNPSQVFDYDFRYANDFGIYWDLSVVNGATGALNSNTGSYELDVTTTSGSKAILQTRRYFQYTPGKSHLFLFTGNAMGVQASISKKLGMFDDNNGFFIDTNGLLPQFVVRTDTSGSVVETRINRADWNGDKFDGTGESGVTLDFTKQQLFFLDYAWLGAGQVRFGFVVNGEFFIAHTYFAGNIVTEVYTKSATLPYRCEIENLGGGVASSLSLNCASLVLEGNSDEIGRLRLTDSGFSEITVNSGANNRKPLIMLRVNPNNPYASAKVIKNFVSVNSGNSTVHWELFFNPTITGTPTWVDEGNSICQIASNSQNLSISGGLKLDASYSSVGDNTDGTPQESDIYLGRAIDGTPDIIVLVAATISSNSKVSFVQQRREYF